MERIVRKVSASARFNHAPSTYKQDMLSLNLPPQFQVYLTTLRSNYKPNVAKTSDILV
jgi:hypothetical protein